jgi:hypothetical protein
VAGFSAVELTATAMTLLYIDRRGLSTAAVVSTEDRVDNACGQ